MNPEQQLYDIQVPDSSLAIFWFGQNSFALKNSTGTVTLIDPYFPHDRPEEKFIHRLPPVDETKLKADVIVLTHDHGDHTCIESIARLLTANPDMEIIGPPESIERIETEGLDAQLVPVVAGESRPAASMTVHAVFSKLPHPSVNCMHLGYVIDTGGNRVYVSGDPQNDFAEVASLVDSVRDLKPEIGLLTTHPTEGEFPFFDGSSKIAGRIGLEVAVPSHYGCFVKRTYNPFEWADAFQGSTPQRIVIPYRGAVLLSVTRGWYGFYSN